MLLRTVGAVAAALAAIWFPFAGLYVAMVVLAFAALPVAIVHEKIAPLSESIGKAIGQPGHIVTTGFLVSIPLVVAAYALVRACFDRSRSEEFESVGIAFLGMLAIVASSYLRFGVRF